MNIVTNLRDNGYGRAYPGQSRVPPGHIQCHNPSMSTLHYYALLVAPGQGLWAADWLKPWEVPESTELSNTSQTVALNVLEMAMCRAFQPLPEHTLEAYYGPKEDGEP